MQWRWSIGLQCTHQIPQNTQEAIITGQLQHRRTGAGVNRTRMHCGKQHRYSIHFQIPVFANLKKRWKKSTPVSHSGADLGDPAIDQYVQFEQSVTTKGKNGSNRCMQPFEPTTDPFSVLQCVQEWIKGTYTGTISVKGSAQQMVFDWMEQQAFRFHHLCTRPHQRTVKPMETV